MILQEPVVGGIEYCIIQAVQNSAERVFPRAKQPVQVFTKVWRFNLLRVGRAHGAEPVSKY
ncbi:hypothetical protein SDC9_161948 [bioreactor metagenome]|uniref:Uncharacterized protein n=1 Tax=bioreactor metagenome TaxID=1076179 RepID=A0A645FJR7_9ZZZZ